jgi:hypothetical protein
MPGPIENVPDTDPLPATIEHPYPGAISPEVPLVIVQLSSLAENALPLTVTVVAMGPFGGVNVICTALTGICTVEKTRMNAVARRRSRNSGFTLRFLDDLALRFVNDPNFP